MALSRLSAVQQISQETKHRDNISDDSRSTSNNSSQEREFNIPGVFANSSRRNAQSSKQGFSSEYNTFLFIVEIDVENSQFRQKFWNILQYFDS